MALAHPHVEFFWLLRQRGIVGGGKTDSVLEFGEQNWFGDVPAENLQSLIEAVSPEEPVRSGLKHELQQLLAQEGGKRLFSLAKFFYKIVLEHRTYRAVDMHGSPLAERHDLNLPLPFAEQFDLVTNLGTAEHVFNQYQVFRSLHERTVPGGLMIHSFPNQGCYDHGFYNYHPTFVFDLCDANRYEVLAFSYLDSTKTPPQSRAISSRGDYVQLAVDGRLSNYSGLLTALRKSRVDSPFVIPKQGFYTKQLPPELADAWRNLPR